MPKKQKKHDKKNHKEKDLCKEPKMGSVLPLIKKKYKWVMMLIVIVAVFLTSFFTTNELLVSYVFLALLLGASFSMHTNLYCFQKAGFQYRPFVMTQYLELISIAGFVALMIHTLPVAQVTGQWTPYAILRILALLIPYQFRSMFRVAESHKKSDPTKCEFC